METDFKNLPNCPEQLKKLIFNLSQNLSATQEELTLFQKELVSYKEKYARLIEEIRLAKQRRFSPSSEKNILQSDIFDEPGVELTNDLKEQIEESIEIKSHIRQRHGRRALPSDFPREQIIYDIPEDEKICFCGTPLTKIGEERSEQLKYIPAQLCVIQHIRPKYACKPCQENVKIAPMPILLLPKSMATPELVAHTIISKYSDHIPLYRQEAIWRRLEIDLPRSSLCAWLLKTAELCEPLVALLRKDMLAQKYIQADETTLQVLGEVGRDNKSKSFMWVYKGGDKQKTNIVFEYQETRGGYHSQNFLKGFNGYLQTDAFSGYNWVNQEENMIGVGCWAHARRPFADCAKLSKKQGLAFEALKFFQKLYAIEKESREKKYSPQERYHLRLSQAPPILTRFQKWLEHHLTKVPEQHKIGQAIRYSLRQWDLLNNYLKDGQIEIDNNAVENLIRPFAVGRKNWLFCGSPAGAKAGAIFYSLIETCKANKIEPYAYFCSMLPQIRLCNSENDYQQLLPQLIKI